MAKGREKKTKDPKDTPMMRQYLSAKEKYPDALMFYRMGDFYEMFFGDAEIAAQALDLTLTSRNKNDPEPIPMCGVPHHAALGYVARLIDKGFKVAICEQMEDPSKVKGLVKREVVRVVTPGVVLDEENLDAKANNFLAVVLPSTEGDQANWLGIAVVVIDASTNEFKGTRVGSLGALAGELFRLEPRELLIPQKHSDALASLSGLLGTCCVTNGDDELFDNSLAIGALRTVLGENVASELVAEDPLLAHAAGVAVAYVQSTRPKGSLPTVRFTSYNIADHLVVDEATKSHLELMKTSSGERKGALVWLLDKTRTGMGGRLLRQWLNYPLTDVARIRRRLDRVDLFYRDSQFRRDVSDSLSHVGDIERLATKIGMRAATPRDLGVLRSSLSMLPDLDDLMTSCPMPDAEEVIGGPFDRCEDLGSALAGALVDEPPVVTRDGGIFREGFDDRLDELIETVRTAKDFIASLEQRERDRTGISSLRVSFNRVFGYYILVTKSNLKSVPDDYVRKQTLATGERFVTPELEEWESKVLTSDERRKELEGELFVELVSQLSEHVERMLAVSRRLAEIDVVVGLAEVARQQEFVRPRVDKGGVIDIRDGRHPLVEVLSSDNPFVPNDVLLDPDGERLLIITGPNMAGKSTVMRQVALIAILAQMGSFVPAAEARIGVSDRLFTRVGASDNIARGASTFMVEMNETADILRTATRDSLIVLDEVGRGTSTYDGLSIAWAVGEYLHDMVGAKVMFATHYHELVELAQVKPHAANYHVAAREYGDEVVFLRKLVEGGTSHSFGIQVAKMAGLPELVLSRAREVLGGLEEERPPTAGIPGKAGGAGASVPQLELFSAPSTREVERILRDIDLDRITPLESLALLSRLKDVIGS